MSTILDKVEDSLKQFRPRTHREFVALQICRHWNDMSNLARYLGFAQRHTRRVLVEAARLADQRTTTDGRPAPELFFQLLQQFEQEGT